MNNYSYVDDLVPSSVVGTDIIKGDSSPKLDPNLTKDLGTGTIVSTQPSSLGSPRITPSPETTIAPTTGTNEVVSEPIQPTGTPTNVINLTIDPISGATHDMDTGNIIKPKETPLTLGGGGGYGGGIDSDETAGGKAVQRKSILPLILIGAGIIVLAYKKKRTAK